MIKQKDILGNIPEIGDIIAYNPPRYKGLVYGECVGFTSSGLPEIMRKNNPESIYAPRTGFVIVKIK